MCNNSINSKNSINLRTPFVALNIGWKLVHNCQQIIQLQNSICSYSCLGTKYYGGGPRRIECCSVIVLPYKIVIKEQLQFYIFPQIYIKSYIILESKAYLRNAQGSLAWLLNYCRKITKFSFLKFLKRK